MPFSKDDIDELKDIHRRHSGQDLTDDEAAEMASRLVRLARLFMEIAKTQAAREAAGNGPDEARP